MKTSVAILPFQPLQWHWLLPIIQIKGKEPKDPRQPGSSFCIFFPNSKYYTVQVVAILLQVSKRNSRLHGKTPTM